MPLRRREDGRGDALPLDVLLYVLLYESSMFPQLWTRMKVVKRHSPIHHLLLLRLRLLPLALMVLHWPLILILLLGVLQLTWLHRHHHLLPPCHVIIWLLGQGMAPGNRRSSPPLTTLFRHAFLLFNPMLLWPASLRLRRYQNGAHPCRMSSMLYFGHYCSSPLCRWHTHYWKRCSWYPLDFEFSVAMLWDEGHRWLRSLPHSNFRKRKLILIKGWTGLFFLSQKPIHNLFRCEEYKSIPASLCLLSGASEQVESILLKPAFDKLRISRLGKAEKSKTGLSFVSLFSHSRPLRIEG